MKILGLGAVGIDYIAHVAKYPEPDEKIRTLHAELMGGGNCANTLTALSRLGFQTDLISKVGDDSYGNIVLRELESDGIGIDGCIVSKKCQTGYTYIIVDKQSQTRTCIHTPLGEDILVSDIEHLLVVKPIENYSIVHFDSRHTEVALYTAFQAKSKNIPISIDCEKDRPPFLDELLPICNYIFTNEHFCKLFISSRLSKDRIESVESMKSTESNQDEFSLVVSSSEDITNDISNRFSEDRNVVSSMLDLYQYLQSKNNVTNRVIVSTLGSAGAILLCPTEYSKNSFPMDNNNDLNKKIAPILELSPLLSYERSIKRCHMEISSSSIASLHMTAIRVNSWPLRKDQIVDSTGAGDSFIGGFLAGLQVGYSYENCLRLSTTVAAIKLQSAGARAGLTNIENLYNTLIETK